jgi:hypothetical protein
MVSLAGADGIQYIENNLFIPLTFSSVLTVAALLLFWNRLHYDSGKKDK